MDVFSPVEERALRQARPKYFAVVGGPDISIGAAVTALVLAGSCRGSRVVRASDPLERVLAFALDVYPEEIERHRRSLEQQGFAVNGLFDTYGEAFETARLALLALLGGKRRRRTAAKAGQGMAGAS